MLWAIVIILLVLWGGGLAFHILGAGIHILLVLAVVALVFQLLGGRRV
jgi:hypothetical protein